MVSSSIAITPSSFIAVTPSSSIAARPSSSIAVTPSTSIAVTPSSSIASTQFTFSGDELAIRLPSLPPILKIGQGFGLLPRRWVREGPHSAWR